MNLTNLTALHDLLASKPHHQIDMSGWVDVDNVTDITGFNPQIGADIGGFLPAVFEHCGTVACIGGWASMMARLINPDATAEEFLGLTDEEANDLFYPLRWSSFRYTKERILDVLDHAIANQVIDWEVGGKYTPVLYETEA